MWFGKLSERERQLVHQVWAWKAEGKPHGAMPDIRGKVLDSVISKLWRLYSSYRSAVGRVEECINDIEGLQDGESVEAAEQSKQHLASGVAKLKEVIDLLEWLRTEQHNKSEHI